MVLVYFLLLQGPPGRGALAVRADPRVYPAVRRAVTEVDPTLPVTNVAEMQRLISDRIAPKRLSAQLIGIFAGLALAPAAVAWWAAREGRSEEKTVAAPQPWHNVNVVPTWLAAEQP